ncbi:hypothetical protein A5650_21185 [Mycobacterium sp. 1164985.4]|nr:hypothetical protein A5650_21185 [Mycobacterium sp. 1164985.4]
MLADSVRERAVAVGHLSCHQRIREAAMTTVFVVTAGSGDTYRIERIYDDREEADRFVQDYNGIAPVQSVHVEEWQTGAPPSAYDGPYWRASWWARVPVSKRRAELRHTRSGERFDDFDIRQEWWTGDALPDAKVVRRELAGIPRVEVAGLSKEKVEELFWDTITQVRADLAGVPRK